MKNLRDYKRVGVQYAYIFDCIHSDDFDIEQMSDREKIEYVFEKFKKEKGYPYNLKRFPNEQDRLADWLQGLPMACSIEYRDYYIAELGKSWGFCQTERKTAEFINNWFNVCALRLLQMRDKLCK